MTTEPHKPGFGDWISAHVGTDKWVVSQRLTPRLAAKGYTLAISQKRYTELWDRWMSHEAPIASEPQNRCFRKAADLAGFCRTGDGMCLDLENRLHTSARAACEFHGIAPCST